MFIDRGACNTWRDSGGDGDGGIDERWRRRRRRSTRLQFLHLFAQHPRRPSLRYVWRRLPSRFTPLMYTLTRCQCLCIIYAVCQPGKAALSVDESVAVHFLAYHGLCFCLFSLKHDTFVSQNTRDLLSK